MKKIFAVTCAAALLAVGGFVSGARATAIPGHACTSVAWYITKWGNLAQVQYYNGSTGHYAYVNFRSDVESMTDQNCVTWSAGLGETWTSDGFPMLSGVQRERSGWYGQSWWGGSCSHGPGASYQCNTSPGVGDPNQMWSDNWDATYTSVSIAGQNITGSQTYSSAG